MDYAYEAVLIDDHLVAISDTKISAEDGDRNRLYVCPGCRQRLFLRGGKGTQRKIHFGGFHRNGCQFKSKRISKPDGPSIDRTNVKKIVGRKYNRGKSNVQVPITNSIDIEELLFDEGVDQDEFTKKKKKTEQTAVGISKLLDTKPLDFVIGIRLKEDAQYVNGKFYANKNTIEYFRSNGFDGYNLILVKQCKNVPNNMVVEKGYYCFRDIYTDVEHDESAIYLLVKYNNDIVEESALRKISKCKNNEVIAVMGFFEDNSTIFHHNVYKTTVSNPACIGKRKEPDSF